MPDYEQLEAWTRLKKHLDNYQSELYNKEEHDIIDSIDNDIDIVEQLFLLL